MSQLIVPKKRKLLVRRPESFTLNPRHPLWTQCVLAGLGRHPGTTRYHDSSLRYNHGLLTNMDPPTDYVWSNELGRWYTSYVAASSQKIVGSLSMASYPITLAAWCRRPDYNIGAMSAVQAWAGPSRYRGMFTIGYDLSLHERGDEGVLTTASTSDPLISGRWHHLAATWLSPSARYGYVDGVQVCSDVATTRTVAACVGYELAHHVNYDYYLTGDIADASIWSRALSPAEIQLLASRDPMLDGAILAPPRRMFPSAGGGAPLAVTEDTFQNASPFEQDETIGTAAATGGSAPYTWEILSQTLA